MLLQVIMNIANPDSATPVVILEIVDSEFYHKTMLSNYTYAYELTPSIKLRNFKSG